MSDLAIWSRGGLRTIRDAKLVIQDLSPMVNIEIQNAEGGDPVYLFFAQQKDLELASVSFISWLLNREGVGSLSR